MPKVKVRLIWSSEGKWHMIDDRTGDFIQEFYPCKNFRAFFQVKNKSTVYRRELTSKRINP